MVTRATTTRRPTAPPASLPYTVVIDTREQTPYAFAQPFRVGKKSFAVPSVVATLGSGDYSLSGYQSRVAVERKSLADLYSTLGSGRARFERELERLEFYDFAAVVVEAEWSTILGSPPKHSRLNPKTVICSVLAWQQRYPRIHWWCVPGRGVGEVVTLRILDRYWRETEEAEKEVAAWREAKRQTDREVEKVMAAFASVV